MKKEKGIYRKLFFSTFQISACTFGGGFVILALLRKRFVEELHWIEEQQMLDLTAIAQSSPGPIAVNASILVGYHMAGLPGALVCIVGTVLPPLIIISVISGFYTAFRDNALVSMVMGGMLAGVAAVVLDVVIGMAGGIFRQRRWIPVAVMAAAFAAVRYLHGNILLIILASGLIGAWEVWRRGKRGKGGQDA